MHKTEHIFVHARIRDFDLVPTQHLFHSFKFQVFQGLQLHPGLPMATGSADIASVKAKMGPVNNMETESENGSSNFVFQCRRRKKDE